MSLTRIRITGQDALTKRNDSRGLYPRNEQEAASGGVGVVDGCVGSPGDDRCRIPPNRIVGEAFRAMFKPQTAKCIW
jgi:hypothetical protein